MEIFTGLIEYKRKPRRWIGRYLLSRWRLGRITHSGEQQRVERHLLSRGRSWTKVCRNEILQHAQGDCSLLMNHNVRIEKNYISTRKEKTVKCRIFIFDPMSWRFPIYHSHSRKVEWMNEWLIELIIMWKCWITLTKYYTNLLILPYVYSTSS